MKALLLALTFLFSVGAFAEVSYKCQHPMRTTWHLYRAQANLKKMIKCKGPLCLIKKGLKVESHVCAAVNHCDALKTQLNDPCTSENRLNDEVRAEIKDNMKEGLDIVVKESLAFLEKIKDKIIGKEDESSEEESEEDTDDSVGEN